MNVYPNIEYFKPAGGAQPNMLSSYLPTINPCQRS
ncbi:hypothetical protein NEOC65_002068 [Neochlamydia sp. AcF65]|nr:hypothetical protein [Neochlamydia sp. AcF65]MBS4169497.1 hypothetical protein [Neochlamydia sp. AcF95]